MGEYVAGNIFMRIPTAPLQEGETVQSHAHNFDHVTFVNHGSVRIEKLDAENGNTIETIEKQASALQNWVTIDKGTWHNITALENHTTYVCVYAHRKYHDGSLSDDECVVPEYTGWEKAIT